jgi:hypothetical protein
MADMKKRPEDVQGSKNTGQQYSDKTGELREGKAQGHPENVNKSKGGSIKNRQDNPNESRIMNPDLERGSDEKSKLNSERRNRNDSSI